MDTTVEKKVFTYHPAYSRANHLQFLLSLPFIVIYLVYLFYPWYSGTEGFLPRNTMLNLFLIYLVLYVFTEKVIWFWVLRDHALDTVVSWKFERNYAILLSLGYLAYLPFLTEIRFQSVFTMTAFTLFFAMNSVQEQFLHSTGIYMGGGHHFWQDIKSYETDDSRHDQFRVYLKVQPPYRRKPSEITLKFKKEQKEQVETLLKEHAIRDSG